MRTMNHENTLSKQLEPFELYAPEYDEWFDRFPYIFQSEVEALREMLPAGESHGIEVGLGTGRFSKALGIKEGVEPSFSMRKIAVTRGVEVMDAVAEKLPYKDLHFDFVIMASCISYFFSMKKAFQEANRVLKKGGCIIIGFIEKDSPIAREYEEKRLKSTFYKHAIFYHTAKIAKVMDEAGFKDLEYVQTLFGTLNEIDELQPFIPGYGSGSYVVVKGIKA